MKSDFRTRLRRGDRLLGTLVTLPCPSATEVLASVGFDWLFIDGEHGPLETANVLGTLQAAADRLACLVRVPQGNEVAIKKVLDLGADGVIVPQVNTGQQAADVVRYCRYAPALIDTADAIAFSVASKNHSVPMEPFLHWVTASHTSICSVRFSDLRSSSAFQRARYSCARSSLETVWRRIRSSNHRQISIGNSLGTSVRRIRCVGHIDRLVERRGSEPPPRRGGRL